MRVAWTIRGQLVWVLLPGIVGLLKPPHGFCKPPRTVESRPKGLGVTVIVWITSKRTLGQFHRAIQLFHGIWKQHASPSHPVVGLWYRLGGGTFQEGRTGFAVSLGVSTRQAEEGAHVRTPHVVGD